jgi:hypothetical protein
MLTFCVAMSGDEMHRIETWLQTSPMAAMALKCYQCWLRQAAPRHRFWLLIGECASFCNASPRRAPRGCRRRVGHTRG